MGQLVNSQSITNERLALKNCTVQYPIVLTSSLVDNEKSYCYTSFSFMHSSLSFSNIAGFPSVGKSTLLTNLAGVYSEVAAYEFTTLTTVPGVIRYKGAKIQLLDLPGIIEGAKDGKGRGRQVIAGEQIKRLFQENWRKFLEFVSPLPPQKNRYIFLLMYGFYVPLHAYTFTHALSKLNL